ncbi:unnamed protein product [marine sediment metagenome]|uniref:Uncharacterized protein n=1 Tax=marine sediment metagenome TaxID=412755 RepID=X1EQL1_9ZZZZ
MAKTTPDKYANVAFATVGCTAIDTLSFAQIRFGVGIFQGIALILHRVLYYPTEVATRELVAATDSLRMAITTSNRLTQIYEVSEPALIDAVHLIGVGVNVEPLRVPIVSDFTSLPGGGRILPANPLFGAINTAGAVAASSMRIQLDFTFVELADKDYIELIQSQLPANV